MRPIHSNKLNMEKNLLKGCQNLKVILKEKKLQKCVGFGRKKKSHIRILRDKSKALVLLKLFALSGKGESL